MQTNFSNSISKLFNEFQVTGQDEATKKFVAVRDNTRRQAVLYVDLVLPYTEMTIKQIASFMDFYTAMEFDDWKNSLEDILEHLEKTGAFCEFLSDMHKLIIIELEKNKTQATVGIQQLEKMKYQYEQEQELLTNKALEAAESADSARRWGKILIPLTFGISALVGSSYADDFDTEQAQHTSNAVAKRENAHIAASGVALTTEQLIPAIESFITCLQVVLNFVILSKTKIERMKEEGEKGAKKPYYFTMKKKANDISELCDNFIVMTNCMQTALMSLPKDPSDKKYVDKWLKKQLKFFTKRKSMEHLLANMVMSVVKGAK